MDPVAENIISFKWITPILIAVIGYFINHYLSSIDKNINDIRTEQKKFIEKVEHYVEKNDDKVNGIDRRLTKIEAICPHNGEE